MTTELSGMHERLIDVAGAARELLEVCRAEDVELPLYAALPLLRLGEALKAHDAHRDAVLARLDQAVH